MRSKFNFYLIIISAGIMAVSACNPNPSRRSGNEKPDLPAGTYGYDLNFLRSNGVDVLELTSEDSSRRLMLAPGWQGRVLTSSSSGLPGQSYGWLNYDLIRSGSTDPQFNPYGGEERFWLGPEGGPYSIYFSQGEEQVYENWKVPDFIDVSPFRTQAHEQREAVFSGRDTLTNAAGNQLQAEIVRTVRLLGKEEAAAELGTDLPEDLEFVAYQSGNTLRNTGTNDWDRDYGFVSIWMLCMFNPSPEGVVFIPVDAENKAREEVLTDDYFGKVPPDRLYLERGVVFFKVDGKWRSKIGISPSAAGSLAAGYDPESQSLTLVTFSRPEPAAPYVNSVWGEQDDPLRGDVVNAYNDGPVNGKVMGPFYEIETSSPAALLAPGEELTHTQTVFHFKGDRESLQKITIRLFDLTIDEIENAFPKENQ